MTLGCDFGALVYVEAIMETNQYEALLSVFFKEEGFDRHVARGWQSPQQPVTSLRRFGVGDSSRGQQPCNLFSGGCVESSAA